MADNAGMSIQPAEVLDVSRQLDELAARVERVIHDESAHLAVTAPGRDEVSQRVAATLNEVHASFGTATERGLGEMHEVAATLRGHSNNVAAADGDFIS
ncbi:PE family protein [Mycolicibacterium rutilum]|uniref:PE family protein n=1 Tax=Mycolicibacterium rutilum TaxID=370526 RepID=A0A1H6L2C0_MYCRU|nr:PE family protein [Mycolicibacterium rutilum]SEH82258.1 PE family protein [Mycolicibacterium rutilum]